MSHEFTKADKVLVIGAGVSLQTWQCKLRIGLPAEDVFKRIFGDVPGYDLKRKPQLNEPTPATPALSTQQKRKNGPKGDRVARKVVVEGLAKHLRPKRLGWPVRQRDLRLGAGCFQFDAGAGANAYVIGFQQALGRVQSSASILGENKTPDETPQSSVDGYEIPDGVAATLFMLGTCGAPWLTSWRENRATTNTGYASLSYMMASLRDYAGDRELQPSAW